MKTHIKFDIHTRMWVASRMVDGYPCVGYGVTPTKAYEDFIFELEMATSDIHQ